MVQFFKECRAELRKVIWPSREEVFNSTIVVLITVALVSVFLFSSDNLFENIFDMLISLGTEHAPTTPNP